MNSFSSSAIPRKVLVAGLGASGASCVRFLSGLGRDVTATDTKQESELARSLKALEGVSYTGHFGGHCREDFLSHELIVISPGILTDHPLLEEARRNGSRVIGEVELASAFIDEPIIAITGTNGKTTTTTLLGRVFQAAYGEVFVGGNIGVPLIDYVLGGRKSRYVIAEISSFQLETIESFRPRISILLNITEDHLDRYTSFSDYVGAKMRVFENQTPEDYAVLNADIVDRSGIRAQKYCLSTKARVEQGAFLEGRELWVRVDGKEYSYERSISPLVGIHNSENLLAVLLASHLCGIDKGVIEETLRSFKGLPHRVEFVREANGVKFYNDSKATNVDATKRALESMDGDIILVAGGKDKGGSYEFVTPLSNKIKGLVLIGEARERIETELGPHMPTFPETTLEAAVKRAFSLAKPGDTVLFSPMCSSFDMFENYKVRGDVFKRAVEAL
jgi:UDP-N-acetylmuramoylalanine--D-glutamate ligase